MIPHSAVLLQKIFQLRKLVHLVQSRLSLGFFSLLVFWFSCSCTHATKSLPQLNQLQLLSLLHIQRQLHLQLLLLRKTQTKKFVCQWLCKERKKSCEDELMCVVSCFPCCFFLLRVSFCLLFFFPALPSIFDHFRCVGCATPRLDALLQKARLCVCFFLLVLVSFCRDKFLFVRSNFSSLPILVSASQTKKRR